MFDLVKAQLLALTLAGPERDAIQLHSRLVEDIGLDSLKFVDLTVGLEDALGIDEFPMQEWVDSQIEAGRELTVERLVEACRNLVSRDSDREQRAHGA